MRPPHRISPYYILRCQRNTGNSGGSVLCTFFIHPVPPRSSALLRSFFGGIIPYIHTPRAARELLQRGERSWERDLNFFCRICSLSIRAVLSDVVYFNGTWRGFVFSLVFKDIVNPPPNWISFFFFLFSSRPFLFFKFAWSASLFSLGLFCVRRKIEKENVNMSERCGRPSRQV